MVVDPCHADWAQFIAQQWAHDDVRRVLDLCCGSGLMTAELASLGLDVVGLDASEAMLARARTLLGPDVPLVQAWLPDLPASGPFDAVVSTLDGLNYLSLPDLGATFEAVAGALRPAGWFVFDLHTDAVLDLVTANPVIRGTEAGKDFTLTSTVDHESRVCSTTIDITGDLALRETHTQTMHAEDDVRQALDDAGFDLVSLIDEYSDAPVTAHTMRATWVARRRRVS